MCIRDSGSNIIIYMAALHGIDNTYYEAAEIDGATFLQKVRSVSYTHLDVYKRQGYRASLEEKKREMEWLKNHG